MWHYIESKEDVEMLAKILHGFHDCCIKEIKYISGAYVNENLSMYPVNDQRRLSVIIQSQVATPTTYELEFLKLKFAHMYPVDETYTCEILGAQMVLTDLGVCWYDSPEVFNGDLQSYCGNIFFASKMRWRALSGN